MIELCETMQFRLLSSHAIEGEEEKERKRQKKRREKRERERGRELTFKLVPSQLITTKHLVKRFERRAETCAPFEVA